MRLVGSGEVEDAGGGDAEDRPGGSARIVGVVAGGGDERAVLDEDLGGVAAA